MCLFLYYSCILCTLLRYSQLNPLCFSLAYSGILLRRNSQRQQSSKHELVSEQDSSHSNARDYVAAHKKQIKNEGVENGKIRRETITGSEFITCLHLLAVKVDDSTTDEDEGEDSAHHVEQQIELHRNITLVLDSLNKAALHLRRAMVMFTLVLYRT